MSSLPSQRSGLTSTQWLICVLAAIGFGFDIYELLMAPLIMRPAIPELTGLQFGSEGYRMWAARLFYVPAIAGGIFGLLGGYLTDLLGRRRVLTGSILLYAFSAFFAAFSTSIEMLLVLRCTTFIGVCVEFVAAISWLAELFDDREQRERVLGYTQAFSSLGGLAVAVMSWILTATAAGLPAIALPGFLSGMGEIGNPHAPWRYLLMSGVIPALPLILIRPFLPESPKWLAKKQSGELKRPSIRELFAPRFRRTTIVTTLMFACSYGAAFGAIQQIPQIVPGIAPLQAATPVVKDDPRFPKPNKEQVAVAQKRASQAQLVQEIGGLLGRVALALLTLRILSRRKLLHLFQIPGLIVLPLTFAVLTHVNLWVFAVGVFFCGLLTVAQFSFWGNYLPRAYPLHLRGTGEGFAANIGGRLLGTSFAALTSLAFMPGETREMKLAYTAAVVGFGVYLAGLILSRWLPEPPQELEND